MHKIAITVVEDGWLYIYHKMEDDDNKMEKFKKYVEKSLINNK